MSTIARLNILALLVLLALVGAAPAKAAPAWLGVYTQTVDKELAEAFDLPSDYGAIVNEVISDSPADRAGLKSDDIILEAEGTKISSANGLIEFVSGQEPGDEIHLTIMRDGQRQELSATLAEQPIRQQRFERQRGHWPDVFNLERERRGYLGVSLQDLTSQLGDYFGVERGNGALVTKVAEDSPAEQAGLKAGDVIVAINGEETVDSRDVSDIVSEMAIDDEAKVTVIRDKAERVFSVTVGEDKDAPLSWYNLRIPDMPSFRFDMPSARGLHRGDDRSYFDSRDLQDQMEKLQEELDRLRNEIQELKDRE